MNKKHDFKNMTKKHDFKNLIDALVLEIQHAK